MKIEVPDEASMDAFREQVFEILLYPGHWVTKEKDGSYSIEDESGNKIKKINIETVIECTFKAEQTSLNIEYIRLEGMPDKIAFNEITLYKPSTKETSTITL